MPGILEVLDRAFETSTTVGAGTYTLDGAQVGFQALSNATANNYTTYFATDDTNWELGIGTILTGPNRLTRDKILSSSNAGAAVNWGAGTRKIRIGAPAAGISNQRALSKSVAGGVTVVLTADEQRRQILEFNGALTADITVEVDATPWSWAAAYNNTTGAYTLTFKVTGQTGIVIPQKRRVSAYCDGTDVRRSGEPRQKVESRAANTILSVADSDKTIRVTAGYTQTFDAAANLGNAWYVGLIVDAGQTLVLDPNGAETINGSATLSIVGPAAGFVVCDGTSFYTVGFSPGAASTSTAGIVQLADNSTTAAGTDTAKAITPAGLFSTLAKSFASSSGYQKLPNGLIVQWVNNVTCNTAATTTVNWPISFPTACVYVGATPNAAIAGQLGAASVGVSSAGIANTSGSNVTPFCIAIGY